MSFESPLIPATLVKRYKRFLADVQLPSGEIVTAHCANSGSMLGLVAPGSPVFVSLATNPERKLRYTWELVQVDGHWVGINTSRPNGLAEVAIAAGKITELSGYPTIRREVKYGVNSRVDLLLEGPDKPICYVEVKNVTLMREKHLEFPDSVTARGAKHMTELGEMVKAGHRAVILFIAQRSDAPAFRLARDIDPAYAEAFAKARESGVEALCYACEVGPERLELKHSIEIIH